MKKCLLTGVVGLGLALVAVEPLFAHGGVYRGPGDVVPPRPGGSGPNSGSPGAAGPETGGPRPAGAGPSGPSTGPTGPATGGGPGAGPGGRGGATTGGAATGTDLTPWSFWWEFNKDPYLNLRDTIYSNQVVTDSDEFFLGEGRTRESTSSLAPHEAQIVGQIVPALAAALEATEDHDIQTACLIALAKARRDTDTIKILDILRSHLSDGSQEVRETAALAMGISQREEAVTALVHLVADDADGRALCGDRGDVADRTRSFAAYGLGLIASSTSDNDVKRAVFEAAQPILEDLKIADRGIRVAAVNALGLIRPNLADEKGRVLFSDVVSALQTYWDRKLGKSDQLIQAHVPTAIVRLFDGVDLDDRPDLRDVHSRIREDLCAILKDRRSDKDANEVVQSAALALGLLAEPVDTDPTSLKGSADDRTRLDGVTAQTLFDYAHKGTDQQARFFSLLGMAKQGGLHHRDNLIRVLRRAPNRVEQGWAALALGVLAFDSRKEGHDIGVATIGEVLTDALDAGNDSVLGALSIALGLCQHKAAEPQLLQLLDDKKSIDELAGYLCIGLALMDADRAQQPLRDLVETSVYRSLRLQQAAIALGRLRDTEASLQLIHILETDERPTVQKMSAISSALSFIGDRRTVSPLVRILQDESVTPLSRAFAAGALGGIAYSGKLPWNSRISVDLNYRAAVESLTNGAGTGVLDIL